MRKPAGSVVLVRVLQDVVPARAALRNAVPRIGVLQGGALRNAVPQTGVLRGAVLRSVVPQIEVLRPAGRSIRVLHSTAGQRFHLRRRISGWGRCRPWR